MLIISKKKSVKKGEKMPDNLALRMRPRTISEVIGQ